MPKATYPTDQVSAHFSSLSATLQIANFAVQLAEQDGEEAPRPLTKDQMNRAFQVLRTERTHLFALLEDLGVLQQGDGSRSYTISFGGKPEAD